MCLDSQAKQERKKTHMRVKTEANFYNANLDSIPIGSSSVKVNPKIQGLKESLTPITNQSKLTIGTKSPRIYASKTQSN